MILDDYYFWLCEKVDARQHVEHTLLLGQLHATPYATSYPTIEVDDIRIRKTTELRERFIDEFMIDRSLIPSINQPAVTCLEILISLAEDAENMIMRDSMYGDRTSTWFWVMIDNLGLCPYTDDNYNMYSVEDILNRFIKRRYCRNGQGSVGYTRATHGKDFRKMDVWQQLNIFLTENYI